MIHHTLLPMESVFDGWDQPRSAPREVVINGVTMLVEPVNESEARIVRLISSNPQDFLNPSLQPGMTIAFGPVESKY